MFNRRVKIFANIDAKNAAIICAFYVLNEFIHAVVVKPHAVDDGLHLGQTKQARFWVAFLGAGRDGPDLDETKTQCGQRIDVIAVLV